MFCRLFVSCLCFALLAGCRSTVQSVQISSTPPGANVTINGSPMGQTPLQIELKTNQTYKVELQKDRYKPSDTLLVARERPDAPYVQFGLKADAGHYRQLTPNPLHVELTSDLVPLSVGSNRFDELGDRIKELDDLLARGHITAAEHARILEQILKVFE